MNRRSSQSKLEMQGSNRTQEFAVSDFFLFGSDHRVLRTGFDAGLDRGARRLAGQALSIVARSVADDGLAFKACVSDSAVSL